MSARVVTACALLTAAALLSACGGGKTAAGADGAPAAAASARGTAAAAASESPARPARVSQREPVRRAKQVSEGERTPAEAKPGPGADPCALVTRDEAAEIVGGAVKAPKLGKLGPTCIYQPKGATPPITLAILPLDVAAAVKADKSAMKTTIARRPGYCLTKGTQRLVVSLGPGRALVVGGPCALGTGFAAGALPRLFR